MCSVLDFFKFVGSSLCIAVDVDPLSTFTVHVQQSSLGHPQ